MPKRHIFNKNSTLVVKRLKYLFWSHTVLSISKLRDVAKAVKSLEIPAFPKLIFQDWFCVISFLDAQDIKRALKCYCFKALLLFLSTNPAQILQHTSGKFRFPLSFPLSSSKSEKNDRPEDHSRGGFFMPAFQTVAVECTLPVSVRFLPSFFRKHARKRPA